MWNWLLPVLLSILGLLANGFLVAFAIGKFTGRHTEALTHLSNTLQKMDERNRKEQDDQWTQIGELREDVSFLKGRGGVNGHAKGHTT